MFRFEFEPGRLEHLRLRFRECTPRILVVTDGSLGGGSGSFGLSHFLDVLASTQIHGMTPIIEHRARNDGGPDQAFDDLSISKFDVVFLFGISTTGAALGAPALTKVERFMQAGGGLFSTGDHEDLGTGMSGEIPRVRQMRYWAAANTPDASDPSRLTTNLPGGATPTRSTTSPTCIRSGCTRTSPSAPTGSSCSHRVACRRFGRRTR
ncbi:MAG: hypothetical protein CL424_17665 [Acidimicrobiaceae bacterium]|nr:hypothetical protein [Acidimicrobiaceae bacterium]